MPTSPLEIWQLRTNPFRPDRPGGPKGVFDRRVLERTLAPQKDDRLIEFYFDLYDWSNSTQLQKISRMIDLEVFPATADVENQAAMVIISGDSDCGRRSLKNLILHKIRTQFGEPPIETDASLSTLNPAENAKEVATLFYYDYLGAGLQTPPPGSVKSVLDEQTKDDAGKANFYATLFQILRRLIRGQCQRPIVLLSSGNDRYDVWQALYHSVKYLFHFIVVIVANRDNAETCANLLLANGGIAYHVHAPRMDEQAARNYLVSRLTCERTVPVPAEFSLVPFHEQAFKWLFKPGPTAANNQKITWPIGWLVRTFSAALDEHIKAVETKINHNVINSQDLYLNKFPITEEAIKAAREKINKGG